MWASCKQSGGKTCAILDGNGSPIALTTNVLRSPFDASCYNDPDASRVNLCAEADEELVEWCAKLDAEVLKICTQHSRKLFGKEVDLESELKANYYSPIKQNEKHGTHLFQDEDE